MFVKYIYGSNKSLNWLFFSIKVKVKVTFAKSTGMAILQDVHLLNITSSSPYHRAKLTILVWKYLEITKNSNFEVIF